MRSIWKGLLQFSLVTIPVRLYSAVDSAKTIHFNLLSKEGHNPVGYEKKDKITGKILGNEDIVRGYQYGDGQYVIIEKEDFDKIRLKSTKVIEIQGFVDVGDVHPTLFEAPYFIGPDGEVAAKNYELFCQTLDETHKIGVGKVVLRDRENPVLISPYENGLIMYKLRYPNEVRDIKDIPFLTDIQSNKEQLNLAKTLVESMTTQFSELEMVDHYKEALKTIIEAKIEGQEVVTVTEEEPEVVDIMTALKASIKAAKKPMEKAKRKSQSKAGEESKANEKKAG